MQFGALWSITRIKAGSKGSSEPGTSHSQEAQHALVWPPCTQPPPPRGPPGLAAGLPPALPSSRSSRRPLCCFGTWYRWQQRGTLWWSQVSTRANPHTASGVRANTGAGLCPAAGRKVQNAASPSSRPAGRRSNGVYQLQVSRTSPHSTSFKQLQMQ